MNGHFLAGVLISLFYFSAGLVMMTRAAVPHRIFGYRTAAARKNMDTWVEANQFAGRLIMITGSVMLLMQLLLSVNFPGPEKFYPALVIQIIAGIAIVILTTESHLKKLFFKDGKRKPFR